MPALGKKLAKALNDQVHMEFHASYLYLSMAAWLESKSFRGMAKWMRMQSEEEKGHAMRIFEYLVERGERVTLQAIEAPKAAWTSPRAAFEDSLKHEQRVTASIDSLVEQAARDKDHATALFLQWFVKEQVEEEASVAEVLARFGLVGATGPMLYMLDRDLGSRKEEDAD